MAVTYSIRRQKREAARRPPHLSTSLHCSERVDLHIALFSSCVFRAWFVCFLEKGTRCVGRFIRNLGRFVIFYNLLVCDLDSNLLQLLKAFGLAALSSIGSYDLEHFQTLFSKLLHFDHVIIFYFLFLFLYTIFGMNFVLGRLG